MIRHFAESFHGPWRLEVALAAGVPRAVAEGLVHDLKFGFPLVGNLPNRTSRCLMVHLIFWGASLCKTLTIVEKKLLT